MVTLRAKLAALMFIVRHRVRMLRFALTLRPIAGGAPDDPDPKDDPSADPDPKDAKDPADDPPDDDEDEPEDDKPDPREPDWKSMSRKHEREWKKAKRERDELNKKLKTREDADKTAQQKAIDEAKDSTRAELQDEFEKERRQDRLELATTKLATKGLTVGTGDDAKTVRFADPDDALVHLEREIRNGDLDPDDIFDDKNRVRTEQLGDALSDLLARKPHLAAEGKQRKVSGSADAGKGGPAKTESTVEDHLNKIRRHKAV